MGLLCEINSDSEGKEIPWKKVDNGSPYIHQLPISENMKNNPTIRNNRLCWGNNHTIKWHANNYHKANHKKPAREL